MAEDGWVDQRKHNCRYKKKKSIFDMHTQKILKKYKKKQKTNKKGYKLDEFVEEWLGRD